MEGHPLANNSKIVIRLSNADFCFYSCVNVRSTTEFVSLSAFAYLYSELVQYHQNQVDSISELERRLESSGFGVGLKVLELLAYRQREVGIP